VRCNRETALPCTLDNFLSPPVPVESQLSAAAAEPAVEELLPPEEADTVLVLVDIQAAVAVVDTPSVHLLTDPQSLDLPADTAVLVDIPAAVAVVDMAGSHQLDNLG